MTNNFISNKNMPNKQEKPKSYHYSVFKGTRRQNTFAKYFKIKFSTSNCSRNYGEIVFQWGIHGGSARMRGGAPPWPGLLEEVSPASRVGRRVGSSGPR